MLNPLEYQFKNTLSKFGYDVIVNGTNQVRILLKEYREGISTIKYRYMLFRNGLIKQGDTITIFEDNWIVLHENSSINDVYTRVMISKFNFDIKFVIADKLYLFHSIIEGDKFFIGGDNVLPLSADTIQVTLPLTEITKQLQKLDAFIKWGQKWEIQGIDYTKESLVILHCKTTGTGVTDDKVNEIAGRYTVDKVDKLNGNIIPILPFDEPIKPLPNIVSVSPFDNIQVDFGTLIDDIVLPSTLTATLDNATTIELNVTWDKSSYNGEVAAIYNLIGTIGLVEGITNTSDVMANIKIVVGEAPPEVVEPTYTVTVKTPFTDDDPNELWYGETYTYTIKKFVDDVETSGNFTFEISDISKATISNATNNSCKVTAKTVNGNHIIKLIITDVDTNKVAIEKTINIIGK